MVGIGKSRGLYLLVRFFPAGTKYDRIQTIGAQHI